MWSLKQMFDMLKKYLTINDFKSTMLIILLQHGCYSYSLKSNLTKLMRNWI